MREISRCHIKLNSFGNDSRLVIHERTGQKEQRDAYGEYMIIILLFGRRQRENAEIFRKYTKLI